MVGFVHTSRRCGARPRPALSTWRRVGMAMSLWGMVWMIPVFSTAIRAAGVQTGALAEAGDEESESPWEESDNDSEPFGAISSRSRIVRELPAVDRRHARLVADAALRKGARCGKQQHTSRRCGGSAVQLTLRC